MDKKYKLKVKQSESAQCYTTPIVPQTVSQPVPQSKNANGNDLLGFCKFMVVCVLVVAVLVGAWRLIDKALHEKILEGITAQARATGLFDDIVYYDEYKSYQISFVISGKQDTLYRAKQGMLYERQKWDELVDSLLGFNAAATSYIRENGSRADCYIVLRDEFRNNLMESRNGTLLRDVVNGK